MESVMNPTPSLMKLSDDVLLMILKHLHPYDLLSLSKCSKQLQRICADKYLWIDIDLRPYQLKLQELRIFLKYFCGHTKSLCINGFLRDSNLALIDEHVLSQSFLRTLSSKSPNLADFAIYDALISASDISIHSFPSSLKSFKLVNCELVNLPSDRSYFRDLYLRIPNLEELDLTGCKWFENHSLIAISKCAKLKVLRLKGCFHIGDYFVYTTLATRFGFLALEVLDVRDTGTGDPEVSGFVGLKNLRELYFGRKLQPDATEGRITDRGIMSMHIDKTPNLRVLVLAHCTITDFSLRYLVKCGLRLDYLDVRWTSVTQEGVDAFINKLPQCKVEF